MMSNGNKVAQPVAHYTSDESVRVDLNRQSKDSLVMTWQNVNVSAPDIDQGCLSKIFKKNGGESSRKQIIQNVSGIAKPGEVMAIMGASGAGKTTLLNVLTFRNKGQLRISADIRINGKPLTDPKQLAAISGYVQQNDIFIGTLKVVEHLRFQAMLRMDKCSNEEKFERVEEIMNNLNLKKCQDTLIGTAQFGIKGISGGEMRRLAFASEIITNPGILFCDEPTSGLDSFMAISIVETMRKLADQGKTIICTIHQPSSEIFEMFNMLYLMAEGRLAFTGELKQAFVFFERMDYKCPSNYNPADFYIKTLAIEPNDREACLIKVQKICDEFQSCPLNQNMLNDIEATVLKNTDQLESFNANKSLSYKTSWFTQLRWLVWRSFISSSRNPMETRIMIVQTIFIAIMFGLIFLQQELNQKGVQNINGVLFLLLTNSSFSNIFGVINTFPAEIPIFLREHSNSMYHVVIYYISKFLVELPRFIIFPAIFATIVYWMCGLNPLFEKYVICVCAIVLVANCAVSFGSLISAAAPNVNAALALSAPLLVPLMIFSGYFLNNDSIPVYFIWIKYISWIGYANEILIINQWKDVTDIPCNYGPNGTIANSTSCFSNGKQIIAQLSMSESNFALDFILLGVLIIAWRSVACIALYIKSKLYK